MFRSGLLAFISFFAVNSYLALESADKSYLSLSSDEFIASPLHLDGDEVSYVKYAEAILNGTALTSNYALLWPPGFAAIVAAKIKWFGKNHYARDLKLWAAFLWALAFLILGYALRFPTNFWVRTLLLNLAWLPRTMRFTAFGNGAVLSESTCLALLLISAALAVIAFQQKKFRYALASVLFLSLASYVRSMFDLVGTVILLSLCLPYVITWIWRYFFTGNKNAKTISRTEAVGFAKLLALLALFSLLNSPWKLQNKNMTGHFEMSADPYLLADKILWAPDDRHLNSWELGGNTACLVDPDLCRLVGEAGQKLSNETKLNLALFLFFRHPVKWIQLKLPYLSALWFDAATGIFSDNQGSSLIDGFFFLALLFAVPWAIHFCFKQYASNGRAAVINFALIFFVVVALHVTIFALKNPRYRYSVPLKVFLLFSPAVLFSVTNNSEEISPTTSP